jgi:hypothetical protein
MGGPGGVGTAGSAGGQQCQPYPVPATEGAVDEASARTALASLDPTATLYWSADRGTVQTVLGAIPLPGCTAGHEVHDQVLAFVGANPSLFNVIAAEWARADPPLPCEYVTDVNRYVTFGRVRFDDHLSQSSGLLTFGVHAASGRVLIFRIDGDYTPATTPTLDAALGACEGALANAADVLSQSARTSFSYLFGTNCNLSGSGRYQPNATDTVVLHDDPVFHEGRWTRLSSRPELSYLRKAWLIIDPANYTPDLLASNASCGGSIGFELTIDLVTARILSYVPGLGCTVC